MKERQTPAILWALYQSREMDDPNIGIEHGHGLLKAVRRCIDAEDDQLRYEAHLAGQDDYDDYTANTANLDKLCLLEELLIWFVGGKDTD